MAESVQYDCGFIMIFIICKLELKSGSALGERPATCAHLGCQEKIKFSLWMQINPAVANCHRMAVNYLLDV